MSRDLDISRLPLLGPRELLAQIYALEERIRILEDGTGNGMPIDATTSAPYAKDSDTSRAAALAQYPKTGSDRAKIMALYLTVGDRGQTRQEVEAALGMSDNTVRPRVLELIRGGWLTVTDETRKTPLGLQAEVLVASEKARREHELKIEEARGFTTPEPVVSDAPAIRSSGHAVEGTDLAGASETTLFTPPPSPPRGAYDEDQAA